MLPFLYYSLYFSAGFFENYRGSKQKAEKSLSFPRNLSQMQIITVLQHVFFSKKRGQSFWIYICESSSRLGQSHVVYLNLPGGKNQFFNNQALLLS